MLSSACGWTMALCVSWVTACSCDDGVDMSALPSFENQVVAIGAWNSQSGVVLLQQVTLKRIGSEVFLVGHRVPSEPAKPQTSSEWFNLARINNFSVYATTEEAVQATQSTPQSNDFPPLSFSPSRRFKIPVVFERPREGQPKPTAIRLRMSADEGKSWSIVDQGGPDIEAFEFTAPKDGPYWFAISVTYDDGTVSPPANDHIVPSLRVFVHTESSAIKVRATRQTRTF